MHYVAWRNLNPYLSYLSLLFLARMWSVYPCLNMASFAVFTRSFRGFPLNYSFFLWLRDRTVEYWKLKPWPCTSENMGHKTNKLAAAGRIELIISCYRSIWVSCMHLLRVKFGSKLHGSRHACRSTFNQFFCLLLTTYCRFACRRKQAGKFLMGKAF